MNRGSKNLVPIAPRPSGAVSLDPRDYQYPHQPAEQTFVWGVPQADVLSQNGMMHMGAYMLPHQNMYSNYSMPSHWIQPTATFQRLPSQGHMPPTMPAQPSLPAVDMSLTQKLEQPSSVPGASSALNPDGDMAQLVPKLDGIEELLNMPLDEDCLEKLLSRDDADDHRSSAKPMELGHSDSFKERGDASGDSTCTADTKVVRPASAAEEGDSVSGAELLTTNELNLTMSNSSVLRTVGAFGDVDLEYLASVHELETASSQDLLGPMTTGSSARDMKRKDVLMRTKSEAALPGGPSQRNPLASLAPEGALQCIVSYLESCTPRHVPSECCAKALEAVRTLQQAAKTGDSSDMLDACELERGQSVPKRKRTQPARSSSQPALKMAEAAEPAT